MNDPLPWNARERNPSPETIQEQLLYEDDDGSQRGLIWPNNEATSAYVVAPAGKAWRLSTLYCGREDWHRPVPNIADLIIAMREIAPIWQWQRRVVVPRIRVVGKWPPRGYVEVE